MREMDFLRGRPAANLARFALPALGANLLQSADQVVDMLVVGAFVGERGLAALANATMVGFVANSLSLGLSVGATVLVSRRLGAGDPPRRLPCGGDGAPRGNRALGRRRAALRGPRRPALRRTRRPGRRARGRRGVHACLGGGAARRLPALRRRRRHARPRRRPHPDVARRRRRRGELRGRRRARARVAAPAAFQQVVVNLSYLAITSMTNAFGTAVVAGAGAATRANTLAGMPVWSAGQAVSAAAARCEGAGDRRRALAYARAGLAVSVGATALVVLLVQASAPQVIGLFADDPDAMAAGVLYLRACCSANSLAYAAMYALDSFAQATGAPRLAAVNALLDAVVVRVGLAALLVPALGYPGVFAAQALSPALPCVVGAAYLRRYARGARPGAGAGERAAS